MVVFTSRNRITYEKTEYNGNTRLVLADGMAQELVKRMGGENCRVSPINYYLKPYAGQDLNGKSLLVWRSAQGFGDLLMTGGILRYLKELYPDARIDFAIQPMRDIVLRGQTMFKTISDVLYFDDFQRYDYHLFYEKMNESCLEPDQPNSYNAHAQFAGINIPPLKKRPFVPISDADVEAAMDLIEEPDADNLTSCRNYGIPTRSERSDYLIAYQLQASTPIRSYPPQQTFMLLEKMADQFPNAMIYVIGFGEALERYVIPQKANIKMFCSENIRALFGLVQLCDLVICPDSLLGHIAEGLERECISLWSSFHPDDRVKYYLYHHPIYQAVECGPCRQHERGRMVLGCPLTMRGQSCRGLGMIEPERILERVGEFIKKPVDKVDMVDKVDAVNG